MKGYVVDAKQADLHSQPSSTATAPHCYQMGTNENPSSGGANTVSSSSSGSIREASVATVSQGYCDSIPAPVAQQHQAANSNATVQPQVLHQQHPTASAGAATGAPDTSDLVSCDPLHTHASMTTMHDQTQQLQPWSIDLGGHQHQPQAYQPLLAHQPQKFLLAMPPTASPGVGVPAALDQHQLHQQQTPAAGSGLTLQPQQIQLPPPPLLQQVNYSDQHSTATSAVDRPMIVTGPNGQQMIVGPQVAASLLQQQKHQQQPTVTAQTQHPQVDVGVVVPSANASHAANTPNVAPQPHYYATGPGMTVAPMTLLSATQQGPVAGGAAKPLSNQQQSQQAVLAMLGTGQDGPAQLMSIGPSPGMTTTAVGSGGKKRSSPEPMENVTNPSNQRQKLDVHHNYLQHFSVGGAGGIGSADVRPASATWVSTAAEGPVNPDMALSVVGSQKHHYLYNGTQPATLMSCSQSSQCQDEVKSHSDEFMSQSQKLLPPVEKRRSERNLREQQRSHKISQQIKELRTVLSESNIPFKPNKFSILLSVVEYIKQLQVRSIFLDAEHRKLIDTIRQTANLVNSGRNPAADVVEDRESDAPKPESARVGNDAEMLFVQGLDYKSIFAQCSAALGVAALDGRFIACNAEFEIVSGYTREELARHSLFNLLTNKDMEEVFMVMGQMLKGTDEASDVVKGDSGSGGGEGHSSAPKTFWSGVVSQKHREGQVSSLMSILLTPTTTCHHIFFLPSCWKAQLFCDEMIKIEDLA